MFVFEKKEVNLGHILEVIAGKISERPFLQFQDEPPVTGKRREE